LSLAQARNVFSHVPNQDPKAYFNSDTPVNIDDKLDRITNKNKKIEIGTRDLEVIIESPCSRYISKEEVLFLCSALPQHVLALIEQADNME